MKKYLSNFVIFLFLIVFFTKTVNAGSATYYQDILRKWGYNSDAVLQVIRDDGTIEVNIQGEDKHENLTILSSQVNSDFFNRENIKDYKRVFLICDNEIAIVNNKCDIDKVEGNNTIDIKELNINLIQLKLNKNTMLVGIPSNVFAIPQYRDNIGSYFSALKETYPKESYSTNVVTNIKSNISPFLTETSTYLISILIFVVVFFTPIKGIKNPKVDFEYIKLNVINFYCKLKKVKGVFLFSFLLLFVVFAFILLVLTYKSLGYLSFSYITNYLSEIFYLNGLSSRESQFMLIYGFILVINLTLYLIFDFVSLLNITLHKFIQTDFKDYIYKWGAIIILFILLFQSVFKFYNWLFVFLLLCLFYIVFIAYKVKITFSKLYNKKEKVVIISSFVLLFIFSLFGSFYLDSKPINIIYQDLISDRKIVMLPYYKDAEKNEYFQDYLVKINYPLFVDNYLIFDNRFKVINNKNLKDFKFKNNYIIVADFSSAEFIKLLIKNNSLLSQLKTDKPSTLFKVTSNNLYKEGGVVNVTIDCSKFFIQPKTLKMAKVTEEDKLNYVDILYFPGCNEKKGDVLYKLPVTNSIFSNDYFVITGIDMDFITQIALFDNDNNLIKI